MGGSVYGDSDDQNRSRDSQDGEQPGKLSIEEERARQDRLERAKSRSGSSGFGLLSAVKHSLSGMMDVDPEATRRANIAKTRDNIAQVSTL
jgi:hypothetical protein